MKTVAVVVKRGSAEAVALAREVRARFPDLDFLVDPDLGAATGWPATPREEMGRRAELVLVLGGDGTLIHAARMVRGRAVPILGVNLGSLGFLTEVPRSDVFARLPEALAGKARLHTRMKLACRLHRGGQVVLEDEVLNDVVINKGALARIADHEVSLDGQFMTTFKSDGVIIATPTGSTAYALAAGGPILHPALECAVVAPICPHALTQRPFVVPGDQVVNVVLRSEVADVYLTLDGQAGHHLQQGDRLEVWRSPNRAVLVSNPNIDYFGILRQKLHWGER
ncbi:MAG TPA: NAD(+)/NADH kinase [Myxococcaceae bacterium]|nr:NAD(+)/NADH kinase [Myxococcaceae bacterium]